MRTVLVTGASCPSATAAIRWLAANEPRSRVIALARNPGGVAASPPGLEIEARALDFDAPPREFSEQVEGLELPSVDWVIHLSAATPFTVKSDDDYYRVNVVNPRRLIDILSFRGEASILNFSSLAVYRDDTVHVVESSPKNFRHDYGLSKLMFEGALGDILEHPCNEPSRGPMRGLSVRVPVLLAPGAHHNFIANWRDRILEGGELRLFNPDGLLNACVWIDTIFDFFARVAAGETEGHLICNVGSVEPISIRDAARTLMEVLGRDAAIVEVSSPKPAQVYDCRFACENGFSPLTTSEAIARLAK